VDGRTRASTNAGPDRRTPRVSQIATSAIARSAELATDPLAALSREVGAQVEILLVDREQVSRDRSLTPQPARLSATGLRLRR
jgi:hypothetical protein